jgi:hypothetical protein
MNAPQTPVSVRAVIEIAHLDIRVDEHREILWRGHGDVEPVEGQMLNPRVLVELDVDGCLDYITAAPALFGDLATLNRVIDVLTTARDTLTDAYGDKPRRMGSCYAMGDYSFCALDHGHAGPHAFDVPEDAEAELTPSQLQKARHEVYAGSWHR